jgi:SAM-dependent methyltransferase
MNLHPEDAAVGRLYDAEIREFELSRLEQLNPVEHAMTLRALARWVPDQSEVVEVGVGGGAYSSVLAGRGCRLTLVDVSKAMLDAASERLFDLGLGAQLTAVHHASAVDLSAISTSSADVVLLLGPLYHLREAARRRTAVAEAVRVLRPGGMLFAAGITRMALLRFAYSNEPATVLDRRAFLNSVIDTGEVDPENVRTLGFGHVTWVGEFHELFSDLEEILFWGVESFASQARASLGEMQDGHREAWLDLVERTAATPEGRGYSDHLLYVGRRRK